MANPPVNPNLYNLGGTVNTRDISFLDLSMRAWGSEFRAPDHGAYEFSNNRKFDSTDKGFTGFYGGHSVGLTDIMYFSSFANTPMTNDILVGMTGQTCRVGNVGANKIAYTPLMRNFSIGDTIYDQSRQTVTPNTGNTPYASQEAAQAAIASALAADLLANPDSIVTGNTVAYPQGGGKVYSVRNA